MTSYADIAVAIETQRLKCTSLENIKRKLNRVIIT